MKHLIVLFTLAALNASAIDSLSELLKKAEKAQAKHAKKSGTAAVFTMVGGERVECAWLAKVGDEYRYQRVSDGKLVATPAIDVVSVDGKVLDATPATEVVVHVMHCNGGYCKPTVKTVHVPAWPKD